MRIKPNVSVVVAVVGCIALAGMMLGIRAAQEKPLAAGDLVARNEQAVGGPDILASIRTLSFVSGAAKYAVRADGRMKVRYVFEEPAVFETLLVDEANVRRNTLDRILDIKGIERSRWLCLARLYAGCFTLRAFGESLTYEGLKTFGPEQHHLLSATVEDLKATFYLDASDFLVKRIVFSGRDEAGDRWEEAVEFGSFQPVTGVLLPSTLFFSRVGVSGTYSPRPLPLTEISINEDIPDGFFDDISVNAGQATASPGRMEGHILFGMFYEDDEFFVRIFTNWTEENIRAAGFVNGDVLVLTTGGAEFETKLYVLEDQVDDPTVYAPGHSLFTHLPSRYPMFYVQFNSLTPKERFDDLRSRIRVLAPIQARKKT